jgi:hypothetical protein
MNITETLPALPAPFPGSPELTMPEIPVADTERDVFARNRETITAALRENADKQIQGIVFDGDRFCFVGCAVKALGKT